jgi:hypothetical protein
MLLGHITDSAEVLHEAISAGRIGIRGAPWGSARSCGCAGSWPRCWPPQRQPGRSRSGTVSCLSRPQAVPRRFRGVRLVCISRAPQRAAQNRKADQR